MSAHDRSREIAELRISAPPRHVKPSFARLEGEAMVAQFQAALLKTSAELIEIADIGELPRALAEVTARLQVSIDDVVVSPDPVFEGVRTHAGALAGGAPISLTHAWGGVAETGTLMFASGADNPTSLAFLPDVHIAAVSRDRIFACYEDALSALLREMGALPRAVNLVTGPSRTGDIGGRIVLGAHGPRHLIVIVYGTKKSP